MYCRSHAVLPCVLLRRSQSPVPATQMASASGRSEGKKKGVCWAVVLLNGDCYSAGYCGR